MTESESVALPLGDSPSKKTKQGWQDSNLRMQGSKPCALPLGDNPIKYKHETGFEPAALALARRCSTTEPLVRIKCSWGDSNPQGLGPLDP